MGRTIPDEDSHIPAIEFLHLVLALRIQEAHQVFEGFLPHADLEFVKQIRREDVVEILVVVRQLDGKRAL